MKETVIQSKDTSRVDKQKNTVDNMKKTSTKYITVNTDKAPSTTSRQNSLENNNTLSIIDRNTLIRCFEKILMQKKRNIWQEQGHMYELLFIQTSRFM